MNHWLHLAKRLLGFATAAILSAGGAAAAQDAPFPSVIVLPGATSAEGVAVGRGTTFYAGDFFGGDIFRGDLRTGFVERFIDAPAGRMAVGLKADVARGLLFVLAFTASSRERPWATAVLAS